MARGGVVRAEAVQAAQIFKLLADEHARIQPALLGHVTEAAALSWPPAPRSNGPSRHRGR